jgi:hypothetical protein
MPAPHNEWQALEQERVELLGQIGACRLELEMTEPEHRMRRDRLDSQIRNLEKRLAEVEARLATELRESHQ